MTKFIEHSDDWSWAPPIPFKHWVGWWISNDDGDAMHGPFETKAEAEEPHIPTPEEFAELPRPDHPPQTIIIKSKDHRRVWSIRPDARGGFDVNGIRNDNNTGWTVSGHHHFDLQADAIHFARSICGLPPLEKETA